MITMALKKVKKIETEEAQNAIKANDGFDAIFTSSGKLEHAANNAIGYSNKNNDEEENYNDHSEKSESEDAEEEMEPLREEKSIDLEAEYYNRYCYRSEDDKKFIRKTSHNDEELSKLLVVRRELRKSQLKKSLHEAVVGEPFLEQFPDSDEVPTVIIPIKMVEIFPTRREVQICIRAKRNLNPKSKLSRVIKAITGTDISGEFDLRELAGKMVHVEIKHASDELGNEWDIIDTIRRK
jgi:hypothetical protein